MSHDPQPLGGKIISKPVMIFGPLIVICMLLIVKRLVLRRTAPVWALSLT
ncbi:hypothetical protein EIMP300_23200 [Escherichia coli]|uniref:Uncharacterized protein n=1 Tax=Escherichia coli TaxID=562 RepID=A0A8S0FKY4_ECOLX|nr:hypothetical protein EIMP300_23200 [Escherichia coli]